MKKIELGLIGLGFALLLLLTPFLNEIHRKNIEALREPPVFRAEDYPRLEAHCRICKQCRSRIYDLDSVTEPVCDTGMELMVKDIREKWGK